MEIYFLCLLIEKKKVKQTTGTGLFIYLVLFRFEISYHF